MAAAHVGVTRAPHAAGAPTGRRVRRVGVGLFFGSVAVNAVLGIAALLIGEFSETHGRILGTSLSVTGALLFALACLPAWERGLLGAMPFVGAGLGVIAFSLVIASIWIGGDGEVLGRLMGTTMLPAVGVTLACVLALPRLAPRFRIAFTAALALIAIATTMGVAAIWVEPESSWYARAFGVVGVLLAATVVSIPVLSRLGGDGEQAAVTPVAFCPFCGAGVTARGSAASCTGCGRTFEVRLARPRDT